MCTPRPPSPARGARSLAVWLPQVSEASEAKGSINRVLGVTEWPSLGRRTRFPGPRPTPLGSPLATSTASCEVASGSSHEKVPRSCPQASAPPPSRQGLLGVSVCTGSEGKGQSRSPQVGLGWGRRSLWCGEGTAF